MAITADAQYELFVCQTELWNAIDSLTGHKLTLHLACDVEVNPLFIISDDFAQNFVLALIFEQISAGLNTSILICSRQLRR